MPRCLRLHPIGHFKSSLDERSLQARQSLMQVEVLGKESYQLFDGQLRFTHLNDWRRVLQEEVLRLKLRMLAKDQSAFQQIPQFPDIARKSVLSQLWERG
jgi:hypothetical protein